MGQLPAICIVVEKEMRKRIVLEGISHLKLIFLGREMFSLLCDSVDTHYSEEGSVFRGRRF